MDGIRIDTPASMLAYGYTLRAWCMTCRRWAQVDLEREVRDGRGERSIVGRRMICALCGGKGQAQLSPPRPAFTGYPASRGISVQTPT